MNKTKLFISKQSQDELAILVYAHSCGGCRREIQPESRHLYKKYGSFVLDGDGIIIEWAEFCPLCQQTLKDNLVGNKDKEIDTPQEVHHKYL